MQIILRAQNIPLDRASAEAAAIAEADPGNPFAQTTVASLAYRAGHLAAAARAYRRSLELDPDRPAVRQNYGKLLRDMDRLEDSEKELRLALEQTDASDRRTRSSLAETLTLVGKTEEAGRLIGDLLRTEPGDPEALAAQGRLLAAQGKLEARSRARPRTAATDAPLRVRMRPRAGPRAADAAPPGHPWAPPSARPSCSGSPRGRLALLRRASPAAARAWPAWPRDSGRPGPCGGRGAARPQRPSALRTSGSARRPGTSLARAWSTRVRPARPPTA